MKQCLLITKLINVLHVHLLGGRQAERRALSPGGKEPQGGLPNPESGRWIWWEKKEDRDSPVFVPSTWSICDSHERSQRSALFSAKRAGTARNAGEGSLLKERLRERARSVFFFLHGQSAPSRADSACSALKQTTHRLCVSPAEKAFRLQGGTHSL